jgi:hypothetical protein
LSHCSLSARHQVCSQPAKSCNHNAIAGLKQQQHQSILYKSFILFKLSTSRPDKRSKAPQLDYTPCSCSYFTSSQPTSPYSSTTLIWSDQDYASIISMCYHVKATNVVVQKTTRRGKTKTTKHLAMRLFLLFPSLSITKCSTVNCQSLYHQFTHVPLARPTP